MSNPNDNSHVASNRAGPTPADRSSEPSDSLTARLAETQQLVDEADRLDYTSDDEKHRLECFDRVWIWGLPLARVTAERAADLVDQLIQRGRPGLFITANLHYAMLTDRHLTLQIVNARATFLLADGMPMVWYSRLKRRPLPERVTGADLIFRLCERAAQRGRRVFLLGGTPGIADRAAENLCRRYPGLQIAGTEGPMMKQLSRQEHEQLIARIRETKPGLLFVALGQPKGEIWLAENCRSLGVPVCAQVGASFDFVAGEVKRAPRWIQRIGMEWLYRISREPMRMAPRYFQNALFLAKAVLRDAASVFRRPDPEGRSPTHP